MKRDNNWRNNKMKEEIINGSLYRYNNNEKIIYTKDPDGFEEWHEYDENGKCNSL